ncbi:MAG: TrbM/KikA/MpfK family conjugal transfer protein, partial [Shewanella sp.]
MNKNIRAAILAGLTLFTLSTTTAKASDPCKVVLCMFGQLTGTASGECSSSINEYFSVKVFKHGDFNPSKTAKKRLSLLNSCPTAEKSDTNS